LRRASRSDRRERTGSADGCVSRGISGRVDEPTRRVAVRSANRTELGDDPHASVATGEGCNDREQRRSNLSKPSSCSAGHEGPADAIARTARSTSGHSLTTLDAPRSTTVSPGGVEHGLGNARSARVGLTRDRGGVIGGRQRQQGHEVWQQAHPLRAPPERHAQHPARAQHPSCLDQRRITAGPDPVEARDRVEVGVRERQVEHVTHAEVAAQCATASDLDQPRRRVKTGDLRTPTGVLA
jgi:hypothetical protein